MFDLGISILWLTVLMFVVTILKRWVMLYLHAVGVLTLGSDYRAIWLRFLVLAPGIFLHEFSHWMTANILLVPTGKFSLGPSQTVTRGRQLQVTMGYVMIGRSDPFRGSLIGAAPFFLGTLAIVAIAGFGFRQALGPVLPPTARLLQVFTHLPDLFRVPDAWLWLYLVFSISNSLMPSESDRRGWASVLFYMLVIGAIAVFISGTREIPPDLVTWTERALDVLLFAFSLTLAVDLIMGIVIYALYRLISYVTKRSVRFR